MHDFLGLCLQFLWDSVDGEPTRKTRSEDKIRRKDPKRSPFRPGAPGSVWVGGWSSDEPDISVVGV
jgi:hypothetical protein